MEPTSPPDEGTPSTDSQDGGTGGPAPSDSASGAVDARVLAALDQGDLAQAATLALQGHGPAILRFLLGMLRQLDAADEAYGQFCEDLWRGLPGFRRQCTFRTFAFQLAHNAACRHLREPYRRRREPLITAELLAVAARVRETTALHERSSVRDRLAKLRSTLDPDDLALLTLRVDQKMGWRDVAAVLSSSAAPVDASAVRKRFQRLKDRLRQQARETGLIEDTTR